MANFANGSFDTNLTSWNAGKTPADITTSLTAWYKADAQSLNDGDNVNTLEDSSANNNDLTSGGTAPTFQTNEINGQPVIRFGGAGRLALTAGVTGEPTGNSDLTMIIVFKPSAQNSNDCIFNVGTSGNDNACHFIYRTDSSKWSFDRYGISQEALFDSTSIGTTYIFAGRKISNVRTAFTNGNEGGNHSAALNLGADSITLGDINTIGIYAEGDLAESILYADDLSDANFADIHSYLALKYGLALQDRGATITRDTATKYAGAASMKIVTLTATRVFENINPGTAGDYVLSCYAYIDGDVVDEEDLDLYYDGSTVATTFADQGSGWYKLTATVTGANAVKTCGVEVHTGKTVYVDSFSLDASGTTTSTSTTTTSTSQTTTSTSTSQTTTSTSTSTSTTTTTTSTSTSTSTSTTSTTTSTSTSSSTTTTTTSTSTSTSTTSTTTSTSTSITTTSTSTSTSTTITTTSTSTSTSTTSTTTSTSTSTSTSQTTTSTSSSTTTTTTSTSTSTSTSTTSTTTSTSTSQTTTSTSTSNTTTSTSTSLTTLTTSTSTTSTTTSTSSSTSSSTTTTTIYPYQLIVETTVG